MKKRKVYLLFVLSTFFFTCILFIPKWLPDPVYKGVKVSEWIKRLNNGGQEKEAKSILKEIGKPAIPRLIMALEGESRMGATIRAVRLKLYRWFSKLIPPPDPLPAKEIIVQLLGEMEWDPRIAPALIKALEDPRNGVRFYSVWALGKIDKRDAGVVIPALGGALSDTDFNIQGAAALNLCKFEGAGKDYIPQLIKNLSLTEEASWGAARALGKLGPLAQSAIPNLEVCLTNCNADIRRAAAVALTKIDANAKSPIPVLTEILRDPDTEARLHSAQELWSIDKQSSEVIVPVLIELLNQPLAPKDNHYTRYSAADLLGKMGPKATAAIPSLHSATNDLNERVKASAIRALQRIETKSTTDE